MKSRTEKEMFELIQAFIEKDDMIRVAILNGSRANPNIDKDIFQDYDVACFVRDLKPYLLEENVVPYFGDTLIDEQPNYGPWPPDDADGSYHNYNMQLMDGNRIDLSFYVMDKLEDHLKDSLSQVLIDKDGLCLNLSPSNESSYYIEEPTEEKFQGCCSAFLFALGSHIPKTLWRRQLPLAKSYTEGWLRVVLRLMLSWEIGHKTGFEKSLGSGGKYLEKYLDGDKWASYKSTYVDADYDKIWDSVFIFYDLFVESALYVADAYGYEFSKDKAEKVLTHIKHVRQVPSNANAIYE
ncbi:aminoglycoside 6-adenylyltransferase [Acidaminobacter sp. JC074]|uniref:aminoglycoside 6-adenylyltransferase n=1 Tax=Acidaminobacter sp. JC074 TaxID=2530199 RepID=UPI001F0D8647|nr:aminoglycoside 6-adenylyltransferase [Acidaminobacter sp. JC074]